MSEIPRSSGRLLAVVVIVLVGAVAAAAIITSRRPPAAFDPDSPEGVVQRFLSAVQADDWEGASSLLSDSLQVDCEPAELAASNYDVSHVTLDDVVVAGEETIVTVSVVRVMVEDPFSPSRFEESLTFNLIETGGTARISVLPWPFYCPT
ncbi:MAG TPA: hypothetical protein VIA81_12370 [Acidimicrobiia bacterium]